MIIWGAKDEFAPGGWRVPLREGVPGAELVVLDDAGHFLMEDDPERVAAEVRGFLESCSKRRLLRAWVYNSGSDSPKRRVEERFGSLLREPSEVGMPNQHPLTP